MRSATARCTDRRPSWNTSNKPALHSGDSSCSLPPKRPVAGNPGRIGGAQTRKLAKAPQTSWALIEHSSFAIQSGVIYILEVNPAPPSRYRAVSCPRRPAVPLAKVAGTLMTGQTLAMQGRHPRSGYRLISRSKKRCFRVVKFSRGPTPFWVPEGNESPPARVMGTGHTFWRGLRQSRRPRLRK